MPQDVDRHDHQDQDHKRDKEGDEHVNARFGVVDCVAGGPFSAGIL